MRKDWTHKTLGEIGNIMSGKSIPASEIQEKFNYDKNYPCYGGNGIRGYVNKYIYDGIFPIIGRVGALCGNVHLTNGKFYPTEHALIMFIKGDENPKFIFYLLTAVKLHKYAKGVAQPVLSATLLSKLPVLIPSIVEQERIVSELDLLSGIIDKQKAQLKELDNLAQSIFYDMFGDPNVELRFTPKRIGEISTNLDSKRKPVTKSDRESGQYPYYGASGIVDYVSSYIFDGSYLLISEDGANLLTRTQPIAFISYGKVWVNNHAHVLDFDYFCSKIYLKYYLNLLNFKDKVKGAAQPKLTQKDLNDIKVSWAPLTLQNTFAAKIENIEKQKEAITRSIAETQQLFDSRMAYWFD